MTAYCRLDPRTPPLSGCYADENKWWWSKKVVVGAVGHLKTHVDASMVLVWWCGCHGCFSLYGVVYTESSSKIKSKLKKMKMKMKKKKTYLATRDAFASQVPIHRSPFVAPKPRDAC